MANRRTSWTCNEKIALCAHNNADLYQAVFRAHGLADRRNHAFWSSQATAPPYYSNLTTLAPDAQPEQLAQIMRLKACLGGQFAVKDGFNRLDLTVHGFNLLFGASWIWHEPEETRPGYPHNWVRIVDPAGLVHWEQQWAVAGSPTESTVFPAAILADPDIAIYGRMNGDTLDAGCIANRSAYVVGLSNIFSRENTPSPFADAVSLARAFGENRPVVGYESEASLLEMLALGFMTVGDLRIWITTDVG